MPSEVMKFGNRVGREVIRLWIICAYLYICFAAITLYKVAILHGQGIEYESYGFAVVEALLVGKFIMIGEAVGIGERHRPQRMVVALFAKAALLLLFLMALSAVEEVITGLIRGRTVIATLSGLWGGTLLQVFATSLLMLLILIPYLAFQEFSRALGSERFQALLFEKRNPSG